MKRTSKRPVYTSLNMPTMREINSMRKKYTCVSTFSGCGGSSTGNKLAGFDVLYANEFIPAAQETYRANHPTTYLDVRDIRKVSAKDILKITGLKKGELDLFEGSPPCHPAGTMIFTKRGYVAIEDIVSGDYVLTHNNRWRKVTGITKTKYSGPLLQLTTMNAEPVEATLNHGFYILRNGQKQWCAAEDLSTADYIKVPRDIKALGQLPDWNGINVGQGYNRFTNEFTSVIPVQELSQYFALEDFWWIVGRSGRTLPAYGCRATLRGVGDSLAYVSHCGDLWVRIRDISARSFSGHVYNMHVEQDESYTANGLASHNCSAFSTAGTRESGWGTTKKYSDNAEQRVDDLFFEYVRLLKGLMPKVFVAENVDGLVKGVAKGYFIEIFNALQACGYHVEARVLNSAYLGVPQARRRLIFVGVRKDLGYMPVFPKPRKHALTVREVLPNIAYIKTKSQGMLTYVPATVPSPTITASDGSTSETAGFSCGGFVEDKRGDRRKYKISELRKLFSFPEDFVLTGDFEQRWERLGRSVPPLMMYAVGKNIVRHILDPYYESLK